MSKIVSFLQMKDGTREDYMLLDQSERDHAKGLPDRVMATLARLDESLEGYKVSRLEHSLQTATRAEADGADPEMVVAALVHDIGDELAPYNHAEIAAGLLRPYVRPEVTWVIEKHGIFQMYYYAHHLGGNRNARDEYRGHEWYDVCHRFCESWDQTSFDPAYTTKPLSYWEPLVRDIFGRKAHDPRYVKAQAA
ncbi:HD domain-containing protein [Dongia sp.]|uniref:HD domain-containing protein n=1 Tax=Dongia sp. TaxID=1977262 RepID=UPI0035B248D7